MSLAIIPARSGSRRIPGKNIRLFAGKPMIAYSIEAARESGLFTEVAVSTDSHEYAAVAKAYGAKVHLRARRWAADAIGTNQVTRVVLDWWKETHLPPEYACCIYATAPMLRPDDLMNGFNMMRVMDDFAFVPGWFYWGRDEWFGVRPLGAPRLDVEPERYIDINTEEDFQKAERMYAALQERRLQAEVHA